MARIRTFTIENFRQFEKPVTLELKPITVLIGANNSGKTTVLQALNVFQYCLETCLTTDANAQGKGKLSLKSQNIGPDEFGRLPVASPTDLWPQGKATNSTIRLTAAFENGGQLTFEITLKYNLFNIKPTPSQIRDLNALLRATSIRMIPIFTGLLPREEYLLAAARMDRERAQRHGEIVRNMLLVLKKDHKRRYQLLLDTLQQLYPDVSLDVEYDEEVGKRAMSAKIDSSYRDSVLTKNRDLIVAGSGLHQAVQIIAGVLQPEATTILLDEPDAHLHARLQERLMQILAELTESHSLQFVIATHSPTLLRAAPRDSILICREAAILPFAASNPASLEVLDNLGALDRMELVSLLQSRRVVFVENNEDRRLLEAFARKHLSGAKAKTLLRQITFLYTYQEPVAAGVLNKARQVRDLLQDRSLQAFGAGDPVRFLVFGDRDYRADKEMRSEERKSRSRAQDPPFGFDLRLALWRRAEIENYLLDVDAMCSRLAEDASTRGVDWSRLQKIFRQQFSTWIEAHRSQICERYAARLQDRNRGLNLQTAMDQARQILDDSWGDGLAWCDAKKVIAAARKWAQDHKLSAHALANDRIIDAMTSVPGDVQKALRQLRRFVKGPRAPRQTRLRTASSPQARSPESP